MATYNILSPIEKYKSTIREALQFVDDESMSDDVLLKLKKKDLEKLTPGPRCTLEKALEKHGWNSKNAGKKNMMFVLLDTSNSMTKDMIDRSCKHIKSNTKDTFDNYVLWTFDCVVNSHPEMSDKVTFEDFLDNFHPEFARGVPTKFDRALKAAIRYIHVVESRYLVSFHFITDSIGKIKEKEKLADDWEKCRIQGHTMDYWIIEDSSIVSKFFHQWKRCHTELEFEIKFIANTDQPEGYHANNNNNNNNNIAYNNNNRQYYRQTIEDVQKPLSANNLSGAPSIFKEVCNIK